MNKLLTLALFAALSSADENPPTLAIRSQAPDFKLAGVDGRSYGLSDFSSSKVLAIVFTCNHCPTAQLYENRIKKLADDYRDKGVALVAIEPNNPKAVRLDELGYTDVGDSFEDMKIRAEYRKFNFPYLYDGETQSVSRAYGPTATPHVFVFDQERKLRYEGRVDNSQRESLVTRHEAREAIDALLNGKAVAVEKTPSVGCSTKWLSKEQGRLAEMARIEKEPVNLSLAGAEELKALRKNSTGKLLLVNFWATWCGPCITEFPEFQTMYRMYRKRAFDLAMVSTNYPDEKTGAMRVLEREHASNRNLLFGTNDTYGLVAAFDPEWNAAVPYTILIGPDGKKIYSKQGEIDPLELRRMILANLPDDDYIGHQAYWKTR